MVGTPLLRHSRPIGRTTLPWYVVHKCDVHRRTSYPAVQLLGELPVPLGELPVPLSELLGGATTRELPVRIRARHGL